MVPMIETAEQAENLAKWCRYRPEGVRGLGFGVGHDDYDRGDVDRRRWPAANERTLVIALIETATGIDNADAILAVPGIDVGWLGHYDLTNTMGITAEFDHPRFNAAVDALLAACAPSRQDAGHPRRHRRGGAGLAGTRLPLHRLRHRRQRLPVGARRADRRAEGDGSHGCHPGRSARMLCCDPGPASAGASFIGSRSAHACGAPAGMTGEVNECRPSPRRPCGCPRSRSRRAGRRRG